MKAHFSNHSNTIWQKLTKNHLNVLYKYIFLVNATLCYVHAKHKKRDTLFICSVIFYLFCHYIASSAMLCEKCSHRRNELNHLPLHNAIFGSRNGAKNRENSWFNLMFLTILTCKALILDHKTTVQMWNQMLDFPEYPIFSWILCLALPGKPELAKFAKDRLDFSL